MSINNKNLFKVLFVWSAIIIGLVGAIFRISWLIVICAFMLAAAFITVRYIAMRKQIQNKEK